MRQFTPLQYCLIGCVGFMFLSSVIFWIVELRDRAQGNLPELPPLPEQASQSQAAPQPTAVINPQPTIRRIRAGVDAEIAVLEKLLSQQKQQEIGREQQRILRIEALKQNDPAFLRAKSSEVATELATLTESVAAVESERRRLNEDLKFAEAELRTQKAMLGSEVGTLATVTNVNKLQSDLATLDCRVAITSDAVVWCQVQQEAFAKALSGKPDAIASAVEHLAKWQPPRQGIAVLEAQLKQLRNERDSMKK